MNDPTNLPDYKFDCWNPWTIKSAHTPFKKENTNGEHKLGAEFNTVPLGQNSTHDLNINNEKWEVKKLDTDGSFNLGVEAYSKFVLNFVVPIASLFRKLDKIEDTFISTNMKNNISNLIQEFNSSWKHGKKTHTGITIRDGLPRGELSQNNLNKLNDLIGKLKVITNTDDSKIELYSSATGEKQLYTPAAAMQKINLEKISYQAKVQIFGNEQSFDQIYLFSKIQDYLNEFKDITANEKLTLIVRSMFDDLRLVLVDEKLGFKPIDKKIENVTCYRITRKTPRCMFKD